MQRFCSSVPLPCLLLRQLVDNAKPPLEVITDFRLSCPKHPLFNTNNIAKLETGTKFQHKNMTTETLSDAQLEEIYAHATQLAKQAGQMLLDAVEARSGSSAGARHVEKESAVDLVTQTDEGRS